MFSQFGRLYDIILRCSETLEVNYVIKTILVGDCIIKNTSLINNFF